MNFPRLKNILHWATIDYSVVMSFLTHTWNIVTGPVTLLFIARFFTPDVQGYYYTFSSILALQIFAELGLGTVIIQFASHEWAGLRIDPTCIIVGDANSLSRLASLMKFSFRWYLFAGLAVAVGVSAGGYVFFSHSSADKMINWVGPWFALCFLAGVNLCISPIWFILEGCNQLNEVYFYRFIRGILGSLSIWLSMVCGANLWVMSVPLLVYLIWGTIFSLYRYKLFFKQLFIFNIHSKIDWIKEVFPMQWRIALSWMSGYLCFSLFTPILFHYHGAIVAGQMGMTWNLVNAVGMISSSIVLVKSAKFGVFVAKGEKDELDKLMFRSALVAFFMSLGIAVMIMVLVLLLQMYDHPLLNRMLPPIPTGLFLFATVLLQIGTPIGAYLRAHKSEPLWGVSVSSGVVIAVSVWLLGSRYGVTAMAIDYLLITGFYSLPLSTMIYLRCRKRWNIRDKICNRGVLNLESLSETS